MKINKIRSEKVEITTDTAKIQRIIREWYKQGFVNKIDNLEEMDKYLKSYNLSRLNQEEIENMSIPITSNEIETLIFEPQTNKTDSLSFYLSCIWLRILIISWS